MSTDLIDFDQENEESSVNHRRPRASVWNYFEKIIGDDGLPKQRCNNCNKVYNCAPRSGTSTMRRHLRRCFPQPLTQISANGDIARSSEMLPDEVRAPKRSKSVMGNDLDTKSDRELYEFIWSTKRNITLLEEKTPDKAITIKETLKRYEDELERRANLRLHKENSPGGGTNIEAIKIEIDYQPLVQNGFGGNMAMDGSAVEMETIETHVDVNEQKTSPLYETGKVVRKFEMDDRFVAGNENFKGNIAEEESAGRLQIVERREDENQASRQHSTVSIIPEDICAELKKVSSVLSILSSPDSFYTPQDNPLDEEAKQAKEALLELLKKDFETIVGSPDEQTVKSCIEILIKNLHKLPTFQGIVIETLNSEFESACQNWTTWHNNIHANMAFEIQQRDNLGVLHEWQEKDLEIESRIAEVDADIVRLKAELREKELTREGLVKQKALMFDQSKMSIEEAKKVLEEMVYLKLQSDVALDNMQNVAIKWERMRNSFSSDPVHG